MFSRIYVGIAVPLGTGGRRRKTTRRSNVHDSDHKTITILSGGICTTIIRVRPFKTRIGIRIPKTFRKVRRTKIVQTTQNKNKNKNTTTYWILTGIQYEDRTTQCRRVSKQKKKTVRGSARIVVTEGRRVPCGRRELRSDVVSSLRHSRCTIADLLRIGWIDSKKTPREFRREFSS